MPEHPEQHLSNAAPGNLADLLGQGLVSQSDQPEVVILREGREISRRLLDRSPLRIGRLKDNDIVLEDRAVSRRHAVLVNQSGQWCIRDTGSRHKLHVDGEKCEAHAFRDGDRVGIGPFKLLFRSSSFEVSAAGAGVSAGQRIPTLDSDLDAGAPSAPGLRIAIPGYEISEEIGQGGMGRVYKAVQLSTRRIVALKVLLEGPFSTERTKKRFEREVRIAAGLRHPNIAQVYESGLHEGRYWFAMEYVEGRPLDDAAKDAGYSLNRKLSLMADVCEAVGYAHAHSVIHRDLKPGNILLTDDGQPRILDFGLAKIDDPERDHEVTVSMLGDLMGTPAYMSPEQTERDPAGVDARTDVYSLGVILYRLLTERFPYDVKGRIDEVIHEIATAEPAPPSRHDPGIDSETEAIILKALSKRPDDRYDDAAGLAADLRRHLAGEPVEARLHSRTYRVGKSLKMHRRAVYYTLALTAAISLTATLTWFLADGKPSRIGGNDAATVMAQLRTAVELENWRTAASHLRRLESEFADDTLARDSAGQLTRWSQEIQDGLKAEAANDEKEAGRLLQNLESYVDQRRTAVAFLALEALQKRLRHTAVVAGAAERLKVWSTQVGDDVKTKGIVVANQYVIDPSPPEDGQWQKLMKEANERRIENSMSETKSMVGVRVFLENEILERSLHIRGNQINTQILDDFGIGGERTIQSGGVLMLEPGQESQIDGTGLVRRSLNITTLYHSAPRIEVVFERDRATRLGDLWIRTLQPETAVPVVLRVVDQDGAPVTNGSVAMSRRGSLSWFPWTSLDYEWIKISPQGLCRLGRVGPGRITYRVLGNEWFASIPETIEVVQGMPPPQPVIATRKCRVTFDYVCRWSAKPHPVERGTQTLLSDFAWSRPIPRLPNEQGPVLAFERHKDQCFLVTRSSMVGSRMKKLEGRGLLEFPDENSLERRSSGPCAVEEGGVYTIARANESDFYLDWEAIIRVTRISVASPQDRESKSGLGQGP